MTIIYYWYYIGRIPTQYQNKRILIIPVYGEHVLVNRLPGK